MAYDPDGRSSSITSSTFGTQSYSYDADGRLAQGVEPSSGGLTAPSTINYDYYPNGWRKDIVLPSAPAPLSGAQTLFTYAYRADGLRTYLQYGPTQQAFTWAYTNAGRETSRTDPYTGTILGTGRFAATAQPDALTYDGYGRVATHSYPNGGALGSMTYDPEGELTQYVITALPPYNPIAGGPNGEGAKVQYTTRGELVEMLASTSLNPTTWNVATGESITRGYAYSCSAGTACNIPPVVDLNVGALVRSQTHLSCGVNVQKIQQYDYTYDAAGRRTGVNETNWDPDTCAQMTSTEQLQYDAENHLISETGAGQDLNPVGAVSWGPNGHPAQVATTTLHWDGDQLLFTTDSTGKIVDVKADTTADFLSTGLVVNSRDSSGALTLSYGSNGFSDWEAGPVAYGHMGREVASLDFADGGPAGGGFGATNRTDGYTFGDFTVQGPRAYDPATQQWTTPDAYAGDVNDPMSQKPYTWNKNNPIAHTDESGMDPDPNPDDEIGGSAIPGLKWTGSHPTVVWATGDGIWHNSPTEYESAGKIGNLVGSEIGSILVGVAVGFDCPSPCGPVAAQVASSGLAPMFGAAFVRNLEILNSTGRGFPVPYPSQSMLNMYAALDYLQIGWDGWEFAKELKEIAKVYSKGWHSILPNLKDFSPLESGEGLGGNADQILGTFSEQQIHQPLQP
jgi:hypothetical protein